MAGSPPRDSDDTVKIREGKTRLIVPRSSVEEKIPPRSPVFYNPEAKFSRDVSMVVYQAFAKRAAGGIIFSDALAGTGARAIRVANEVDGVEKAYINDLNPKAVEYAKATAALNNVEGKCVFSVEDACLFLISHSAPGCRFDVVDIDPFGSPAPYLDCAVRATRKGGLISVTATDTAVLCGIYPTVAYRKYFGSSLRSEYCHEVGVRLLLGALAFTSMRLDAGVMPVFAHSTRHYFRVYVVLSKGAREGEKSLRNIGYICHCPRCENRFSSTVAASACGCGGSLKSAGPLWVGELYDASFLDGMIEDARRFRMRRVERLATVARSECGMPATYYVVDRVADRIGVPAMSPLRVVDVLLSEGFRASRTAVNPKGVKTDASVEVIEKILRGC